MRRNSSYYVGWVSYLFSMARWSWEDRFSDVASSDAQPQHVSTREPPHWTLELWSMMFCCCCFYTLWGCRKYLRSMSNRGGLSSPGYLYGYKDCIISSRLLWGRIPHLLVSSCFPSSSLSSIINRSPLLPLYWEGWESPRDIFLHSLAHPNIDLALKDVCTLSSHRDWGLV